MECKTGFIPKSCLKYYHTYLNSGKLLSNIGDCGLGTELQKGPYKIGANADGESQQSDNIHIG